MSLLGGLTKSHGTQAHLRIEALVGAVAEMAHKSKKWLPLALHSQMSVEQQVGGGAHLALGGELLFLFEKNI